MGSKDSQITSPWKYIFCELAHFIRVFILIKNFLRWIYRLHSYNFNFHLSYLYVIHNFSTTLWPTESIYPTAFSSNLFSFSHAVCVCHWIEFHLATDLCSHLFGWTTNIQFMSRKSIFRIKPQMWNKRSSMA